jgi:hypothetical protein
MHQSSLLREGASAIENGSGRRGNLRRIIGTCPVTGLAATGHRKDGHLVVLQREAVEQRWLTLGVLL